MQIGSDDVLAALGAELRLSKEILSQACETRELVREEAGKTRDLINANTLQDVRDNLTQARLELASCKCGCGKGNGNGNGNS